MYGTCLLYGVINSEYHSRAIIFRSTLYIETAPIKRWQKLPAYSGPMHPLPHGTTPSLDRFDILVDPKQIGRVVA